jgi:hypothetical protein
MMTMTTNVAPADDEQYQAYERALVEHFSLEMNDDAPLFTTDVDDIFAVFLAALPEARRQHYNCHACRRFLNRYGALVRINYKGQKRTPIWNLEAPPFFAPAAAACAHAVARAKVTGIFLASETTWGLQENTTPKPPGVWRHLHVVPPPRLVFAKTPLQTAEQRAAERREEHHMLCRGLADFPIEHVRQAHTLLTSGNLYRSEKCIGVAEWLLNLHTAHEAAKGEARDNVVWLAVATAPAGFCHVRSGMIGTLLEDIQLGLAFADIKAKFDAKMHPLMYQRPQAAPSAAQIAQAEKIVAELASAGALARRFARLEDLETIWTPKAVETVAPKGGVFGHLKPKGATTHVENIEQPPVTMTWEKFARTVLPEAESIELLVPAASRPYSALVTAANADAPPIIQWDRLGKRNPVTWYVYHGGSTPGAWGLKVGWCRVTAITLHPSLWSGAPPSSHQGTSLFLILEGAKDTQRAEARFKLGGGFFPELLRSEYHAVRATMEAFARAAEIAGWEEATACGLKVEKGATGAWNYVVRVTLKGGTRLAYNLDRWD